MFKTRKFTILGVLLGYNVTSNIDFNWVAKDPWFLQLFVWVEVIQTYSLCCARNAYEILPIISYSCDNIIASSYCFICSLHVLSPFGVPTEEVNVAKSHFYISPRLHAKYCNVSQIERTATSFSRSFIRLHYSHTMFQHKKHFCLVCHCRLWFYDKRIKKSWG